MIYRPVCKENRALVLQVVEQEFNPEFVKHMYPRLEWGAMCSTATSLDLKHDFPVRTRWLSAFFIR
jgi:hypothetical protein